MQLTERDINTLRWVNDFGMVTVEQVAKRWGVDFATAARRVRALAGAGLLRRELMELTSIRPLVPTKRGCEVAKADLPPITGVRRGQILHDLKLVDIARSVVSRFGGEFEPARRIRMRIGTDHF